MGNKYCKVIVAFICVICLSFYIAPLFYNNNKIADAGLAQDTIYSEKIYMLRNKYTNRYLDVQGGSSQSGTNIQTYDFTFGIPQKFKVIRIGTYSSNYCEIRPMVNLNLRLDVQGGAPKTVPIFRFIRRIHQVHRFLGSIK